MDCDSPLLRLLRFANLHAVGRENTERARPARRHNQIDADRISWIGEPAQQVVRLMSNGADIRSVRKKISHIAHAESSENIRDLKSDGLVGIRKTERGGLTEIEVGVRCKHLARPLPKSFSRLLADFENVVELKLFIVDQTYIGEATLLFEVDPSIDVCER